ncbi:hypothetical protein L6R53_09240, partial [Myxococcota bacterium]|nr:hypothetical protein [Myxococcota bacterium]
MRHRPRRWHRPTTSTPDPQQLLLPGVPALPRAAPRPARILGNLVDAGDHWRVYACTACGRSWQQPISDEEEGLQALVQKRACPWCTPAEVLAAWGLT